VKGIQNSWLSSPADGGDGRHLHFCDNAGGSPDLLSQRITLGRSHALNLSRSRNEKGGDCGKTLIAARDWSFGAAREHTADSQGCRTWPWSTRQPANSSEVVFLRILRRIFARLSAMVALYPGGMRLDKPVPSQQLRRCGPRSATRVRESQESRPPKKTCLPTVAAGAPVSELWLREIWHPFHGMPLTVP
jgi:hypothetical protein